MRVVGCGGGLSRGGCDKSQSSGLAVMVVQLQGSRTEVRAMTEATAASRKICGGCAAGEGNVMYSGTIDAGGRTGWCVSIDSRVCEVEESGGLSGVNGSRSRPSANRRQVPKFEPYRQLEPFP